MFVVRVGLLCSIGKEKKSVLRDGAVNGDELTDIVLKDGVGGVNSDFVIRLVAVLNAQVVFDDGDVDVRDDKTVLNVAPDNAGHLVAVQRDDGLVDLDFVESAGHEASLLGSDGAQRGGGEGLGDGGANHGGGV